MLTRFDDDEEPPDLGALPEDEWRDALRPLLHRTRMRALRSVRSGEQSMAARVMIGELEQEDWHREDELRNAAPAIRPTVPENGAVVAPGRILRQVNFRLTPDSYELLAGTAASLGLKPAQLARLFVERGLQLYRPTPGLGTGDSPDQS